MIKSSILALVTVAALGSIAAPAFADSGDSANDSLNTGSVETVADSILVRLQQQGVQATEVEAWGGLVRAYVTQPDGTVAMQYFAADSLKPATL